MPVLPEEAAEEAAATDANSWADAEAALQLAIDAWEAGDWRRAALYAERALAHDPESHMAMLLEGWAMIKAGRRDDGVAALERLAALPIIDANEAQIQVAAEEVAQQARVRGQRRSAGFTLAFSLDVSASAGRPIARPAPALSVQIPVWRFLAIRSDWWMTFSSSTESLAPGGPNTDWLVVAEWPIPNSIAALDFGAGVAVWRTWGAWWPEGRSTYAGVRLALGADVRTGERFGLRVETGATSWPGLYEDLGWYRQPVDARMALAFWF